MSDFIAAKDESEIGALEAGSVQSFDIDLFEEFDRDSGFHTMNDPKAPFQRSNVVQRKGAVDVKCSCIDIVHGTWGPEEPDVGATIVVLHFRFDPRRRARRIASAHIEFKFFDAQGRHRKNPEVFDISLNDSFSLSPTQSTVSTTRGGEGELGGGILGANLSGKVHWEKEITQDMTDAIHVVGSVDRLGTNFGPSNTASWTLTENGSTKQGIPSAMRVGILLRRSTDDDFMATVKLKTEVDLKTNIEALFGGREADDPILFRPSMPPTNKLMKYDVENLGNFDVRSVEDVTLTVLREGVVKS
jgi:hypothetical protein